MSWLSGQLKALVAAMQFLTRFKMPDQGPPSPKVLHDSVRFYPVAGLALGCALGLVSLLAHVVYASSFVSAILVVAVDAWLTGGLHLDGLMDSADGLLSYRSRERSLEIMRDSRVGAMAVIALGCTLLLRVAALSAMPPLRLAAVAFFSPLFARALLLCTMRFTNLARDDGLGRSLAPAVDLPTALGSLIVALALGWWLFGWNGLVAATVAVLGVSRVSSMAMQRLGGMTGDTYGASVEVSQVLLALALAVRG